MSRLQRPSAQRKKASHGLDTGLPFPNFALGKTEIPAVCRCIYDGTNFFVTNHLDMHTLHYNGSFGTSSVTFRGLSYDDTSFVHRAYYQKHCLKNSTFPNGMFGDGSNGGPTTKYVKAGKGKRIRVDVESSRSGPELCVHISEEDAGTATETHPESIDVGARHRSNSEMSVDGESDGTNEGTSDKLDNSLDGSHRPCHREDPRVHKIDTQKMLEEEKLILMPEEAIFLSFGVGCLAIYNVQGQAVDYRQCWKNLVTINPGFPAQYAAYHYFRGKNWVPKRGDNFGASYVLYEGGPDLNHSTYIVHIIDSTRPKPTWLEMSAWQRLATHVSKHVLLCEVSIPLQFRPEFSEPRSVFDMTLKEMSLMRWLPRDSQSN